jgi:hypothetical protein
MLIPLTIPPGIVKNGTSYQRRGRWTDSNLVRWHNKAIRAMGGWLRRTDLLGVEMDELVVDPTVEAVRDAYTWYTLTQEQNTVFASNTSLYYMSKTNTVTDITPIGADTSAKDAVPTAAYGKEAYSAGAYGVATVLAGQKPVPVLRWAFDNFGQLLLAQQRGTGPIYEVDPATITPVAVTNAPEDCQDVIVTAQRIVFTLGADGEPRLVKWSDQEDRNTWTAAISNQAGDLTLQGSGKLLKAMTVLKQIVIVGEDDVHIARYVGPPYVYSVELAARNCGAIHADAVVGSDRFAVWWGNGTFWLFDGAVQELPCDVQDFLNDDVDFTQISKVASFTNQEFSEVWWLYQSNSTTTTETDSYVVWNYRDNTWWTGRIDRTVGIDSGPLFYPIMVDHDGFIYNHEQRGVLVDGAAYIESAPLDLAGGEKNMAIRYVYPDTETFGDIQMTIYGRQMPTDTVYAYGPYTYNNPTPVRAMGRELAVKFEGTTANFEVGTMRLDAAPVGTGQR